MRIRQNNLTPMLGPISYVGLGIEAFSSGQQSSPACHLLADDSKSWTWDLGVFVLAFQVLALEIFQSMAALVYMCV
ncbi:hypothetical protein K0M31_017484 [Melipona bicolor]|uniref:Uncharacterized protein n=1 Tax=Melipona bicolor TaxID=60889 RepID=A0AA40G562_9HYME|nr:hypothetical protein K0M31_017484 [Melipona bicolor]